MIFLIFADLEPWSILWTPSHSGHTSIQRCLTKFHGTCCWQSWKVYVWRWISKEINYVLLDELKTYKQYYSLPPEEEDFTLEINDVKEEQNVIKQEKSDSYEAAKDNQ